MTTYVDFRSFFRKCIFLTLFVAARTTSIGLCNSAKCPGPLKYYEELGCTPVYHSPGDCCAERYDCSHLKNLSKDKCYVNGHEYDLGEGLKPEDKNACDVACSCGKTSGDVASFVCAIVDCPILLPSSNCSLKYKAGQCCPEEVCLKEGEKWATCKVDGEVYKEGDYFVPKSEPEKECHCMPGYKGENVEPFCRKPNRSFCSPLFSHASNVHENCVPVYYDYQVPQEDCNIMSRCQNSKDLVIHNHDSKAHIDADENNLCRFGNMTMHIGDELNQGTYYDSACVKCVCEVPPIPTCQRLPNDKCDVTVHEPFE